METSFFVAVVVLGVYIEGVSSFRFNAPRRSHVAKMPEVGEVVDDVFLVESEIDSGNFGSIYKVEDQLEKRQLALKVLRPGPHDEDELRRRFEREARLVYSLDHRHIVKVHYYGETTAGLPYMAMEYLMGTDLRTLLHHHGSLKPKLIKRITLETLAALEAAHNLGIIHRDLKPANIFLVNDDNKGHVKVLDFGFAKALDDEESSGEITNAGTLVGTPAYMSPELVHKKHVGPAADIYAMGLIMAEMVTSEKLVQIENVYDTILFQASGKPIKLPREVRESVYGEVIQKAIAKSLEDRYKDAEEMARAIYEVDGEPYQPLMPARARVVVSDSGSASEHLVFGDAPDDDLTVPRSLGPDISEIETDVRKSYDVDFEDDDPEPTDSATITPADTAHGMRRNTPNTPIPDLRRSTGEIRERAEVRKRFSETLDMRFEPPVEREKKTSLLYEILAGLVLALVALAVLFFFVYK